MVFKILAWSRRMENEPDIHIYCWNKKYTHPFVQAFSTLRCHYMYIGEVTKFIRVCVNQTL